MSVIFFSIFSYATHPGNFKQNNPYLSSLASRFSRFSLSASIRFALDLDLLSSWLALFDWLSMRILVFWVVELLEIGSLLLKWFPLKDDELDVDAVVLLFV